MEPAAEIRENSLPTAGRLHSLDAFRGVTMFWLLGGKAVVVAVAALAGWDVIRYQLTHSAWEGVRYYDLIWPSFMLMVGVAVPFSFAKRAQTQSPAQMKISAWKRAAVLFLLGSLRESLSDGVPRLVELSSALQPIAFAYLGAVYLAGRPLRLQIGVTVGVLAGYAGLLAFVPGGGQPAGTYVMNQNLVSAVDMSVLGRTHRDGWGTVLSTLPTIATTLVGLMLGQMLMSSRPDRMKLRVIALTGLGCLAGGYALSPVVPIIMKLWTASYALVVTGWACLLFLPFYWIIDVKRSRGWALPLVVIGTNALAAYLLPTIIPLSRIVGVFTKAWTPGLGAFGPLVSSVAVFATGWLILWWMYGRKLFLRV